MPSGDTSVDLHWVDGKAPSLLPVGAAFGVPWDQGLVDKTTAFALNASGKGVPVQSWPLAYWPDGSLKWTGHALASDGARGDSLSISSGTPTEPQNPVSVSQDGGSITVSTGSFSVKFNTSGTTLIDSLSLDGSAKASSGVLVINVQNGPDEPEIEGDKPSIASTNGTVDSVTVEQNGPVRAVIKVTGKYTGGGHADFLPFIVRFYVSAGATALRMNHFFLFDGDQKKDFIKGIGLRLTVPLSDELYNRHVRFVTTDGGIWGEPIRVLSGLRRDATAAVLNPQFAGQATPDISTWPTSVSSEIDQLPVWNDFTLDQVNSETFKIKKRASGGRDASFLDNAGFGHRASGVGYVGGANAGGLVFAIRDFWQGGPRGLDIRNAGTDIATVTAWAYSPRAIALDMRHYDTVAHGLDLTYEDVGDPDPDPTGIGRSYEVSLQVFGSTPSRDDLANWSAAYTAQPQVVASPEFYASRHLFGGRWSTPTDVATIEDKLKTLLDFYVAEIQQREIYGFWDFGDVYHTYDNTRHTWRYDVGGFAWDNGELGTDLWLWMSFLRTGRADIFRLASRMTRHLSEVDTHHIGPYAGLGSRHNVNHWGDGAKEARVSGAALRRPYYYLTADELMGDIMDYSLQADQTIVVWEPLRKVLPPPDPAGGPGRVRIGPDWTTLAGNWFTKWERTMDSKWLDRITTGMRDIASFKFGLFTGNSGAVGWNPDTAHLVDVGGQGEASYHLEMLFGGGELLMEMVDIINEPDFKSAWLDFCRLFNGTDAEKTARYGITFNSGGFANYYAKLQVYAGVELKDDSIKQRAWTNFNSVAIISNETKVGGTNVVNPITEIVNVNTNDSSQVSLTAIVLLALAPELAPASIARIDKLLQDDWDVSTVAGDSSSVRTKEKSERNIDEQRKARKLRWRKLICL